MIRSWVCKRKDQNEYNHQLAKQRHKMPELRMQGTFRMILCYLFPEHDTGHGDSAQPNPQQVADNYGDNNQQPPECVWICKRHRDGIVV